MRELLHKSCKLTLKVNNKILFYTVQEVTSVTETHINFVDKFGEYYMYRIEDIVEVSGVSS